MHVCVRVCVFVCTWCTGSIPLDHQLSGARVRLQVKISGRRQSWSGEREVRRGGEK